ncbi:transcription termination/antitermination NusG family protein [uncultured Ruegeria sp.]|uniref:transcription termination/antitermination protein NusG n=1 Tax=uncultured Ruegeria sp. TaxID=259304 RepID=UPI002607F122|nr:transcription termination/antitermination NusG family protein [uncultured Ruegeria sp.]
MTKRYNPLQVGDPWPFESARGIVGTPCDPVWYALITRPQKERETRHKLQNAGCVVRYPTIDKTRHIRGKKHVHTVPIIPRIIYAKFKYTPQWDVMKDRKVVVGVFSVGDLPLEISEDKVNAIMGLPSAVEQERQAAHEAAEKERLLRLNFKVGDRAMLTEGPFAGFFVDVTKVELGKVFYHFVSSDFPMKGEDTSGILRRVAE